MWVGSHRGSMNPCLCKIGDPHSKEVCGGRNCVVGIPCYVCVHTLSRCSCSRAVGTVGSGLSGMPTACGSSLLGSAQGNAGAGTAVTYCRCSGTGSSPDCRDDVLFFGSVFVLLTGFIAGWLEEIRGFNEQQWLFPRVCTSWFRVADSTGKVCRGNAFLGQTTSRTRRR